MIDGSFLALKITYLMKQSGKNRLTISEAKIKLLAQKEVLTISYLGELKQNLEELGIFLGTLKKGAFCLLMVESLEGAPSLPIKEDSLGKLAELSKEQLESLYSAPIVVETITDNVQDEQLLLLNELWLLLIQTASNKEVITYGALAKKLESSLKYKVHHKKVMVLLEPITQFCSMHNYPTLTYLAVNDKLQLPKALENGQDAKNKFEEVKSQIYSFNWNEQKNNFDNFLSKNKEN